MTYAENGMPAKNPLSAQIDLSKFSTDDFVPASAEEKAQQEVMGESVSFFKDGLRRLMRNKLAMTSIIVLLVMVVAIVILPMIIPYGYDEIIRVDGSRDRHITNLAPFQYSERELEYMAETGEKLFPHVMGTDSLGRDYFVRVLIGTRVSLAVGLVASIMVLIIGLLYGSISAWCGGVVDMIMMRIVDIIYSLPDTLMVILLSVVLNQTLDPLIKSVAVLNSLGTNMIALFLVFGLLYWVSMARLVRGQILTIKQNEYVLAARTIGTPSGRILRKHILPNCLSVIIISVALQIPSAIFTESYLSFLGIGVKVPMPSLGSLANEARGAINTYPWQLVFPAVVICLVVLAFNLVGDGLRDAFDPKLKR